MSYLTLNLFIYILYFNQEFLFLTHKRFWKIRYKIKSKNECSVSKLEEYYTNEIRSIMGLAKHTFLASPQRSKFIAYETTSAGIVIDAFFSPWSQRYVFI